MKKEIEEIIKKTKTVTSVASELNVSRQTVYKWLNRYQKDLGNGAFSTLFLKVEKAIRSALSGGLNPFKIKVKYLLFNSELYG